MSEAAARAATCFFAGAFSVAAAIPSHAAPFFPPFGLDIPSMDKSVRPQDDFFRYVNGGWIARTAIPADKPGIDTFEEISDRTEARLHTLLEQQAAFTGDPVTPGQKSGAMYAAFMDEAPELGGLTGDQRFFLSWAQGWRIKARPDAIKEQIVRDLHSFDKFRAIGPLQNVDAWYAAFDVKPRDKMYRAPEVRAKIW